jgi:hypothetical protein
MSQGPYSDPYLLTSLSPRNTGLPVTVHARVSESNGGRSRMTLFVSASSDIALDERSCTVVEIAHDPMRVVGGRELSPELMQQVGQWVSLNRTALDAHWRGRLDSVELARHLRRLLV